VLGELVMKKEAYDKFMKKISSEFKNVDTVKEFLLDAAELAMYGEKRVDRVARKADKKD
jgi:stalled ribosome rescue protein Dom34